MDIRRQNLFKFADVSYLPECRRIAIFLSAFSLQIGVRTGRETLLPLIFAFAKAFIDLKAGLLRI